MSFLSSSHLIRRSLAVGSVIIAMALISCTSVNSSIQQHSAVPVEVNQDAININTAEASELQRIPHIGEKLAADIIEFRERFGPFRRAEQLLLVNGVSDARFRDIRHLVRVD
ncbi:MAG: ComEA family DNA-binding protein [Pyrinomonadaceae bacterium]